MYKTFASPRKNTIPYISSGQMLNNHKLKSNLNLTLNLTITLTITHFSGSRCPEWFFGREGQCPGEMSQRGGGQMTGQGEQRAWGTGRSLGAARRTRILVLIVIAFLMRRRRTSNRRSLLFLSVRVFLVARFVPILLGRSRHLRNSCFSPACRL